MKMHLALRFCLAAAIGLNCDALSAATFAVTNVLDSGPGSLRAAIDSANSSPGLDTIEFNIPGTGPHIIQPIAASGVLPAIIGAVTIDGYSRQQGAKPNTMAVGNDANIPIVLNGSRAGANADGLFIAANDVTIRGLVINGFSRAAIRKTSLGGGSVGPIAIEGCFIGTDSTGLVSGTNQGNGIDLTRVANLRVGGTNWAARNIISGNRGYGIYVSGDANTIIQGNYIGTDKNGTNPLGNGFHGILTDFGSTNCLIGGSVPGARNVISGSGTRSDDFNEGIELRSNNSRIQGNCIGLDVSGTKLIGNGDQGIAVFFGNNNTIGGTNLNEGNVIAGNGGDGVFIIGEATGTVTNGVGNAVLGNSIYGNGTNTNQAGAIGIDLFSASPGGITPNDVCDADVDGGNRFQNFPVLASAASTPSSITLAGSLNGAPNTTYLLEFFASSQRNSGGYVEGETFIARTNLTVAATPTANCANPFSFTFPVPVAGGKLITATASRILGNGFFETSEFSLSVTNGASASSPTVTITSSQAQNSNLRIDWTAPGGTTNYVQAAATLTGAFANISPAIVLPAGSAVATNYVDPGVLTNRSSTFYRILIR